MAHFDHSLKRPNLNNTITLISKHLRELYFGKNWTAASFPTVMDGIGWQLAIKERSGFNSIATLVYHMNYYVITTIDVINGSTSVPPDKDSFIKPAIHNEEDWEKLKMDTQDTVNRLLELLSGLEDDILLKTFVAERYGSYYRNIQGMIEHSHYHLGQIMILKKLD